jgi:hypothetical protein
MQFVSEDYNKQFGYYELKKYAKENPKSAILKDYVILVSGWHQYVEGITGVNRWAYILVDEKGFPFTGKSAAVEAAKKAKIKSHFKKGRPNVGYGSVNSESEVVKSIRISDLITMIEEKKHPHSYGGVLHYADFKKIKL